MKNLCLLTLMSLAFSSPLFAQTEAKKVEDWKFSAQAQMRTEYDGRDFNHDTYMYNFTTSRLRFAAEKTIFTDVTGFIQIQDSRLWGSENNTIANSKNLDLHQGYIRIDNIFNSPIWAQAGRFKMKYGSERWISYNEFSNITRYIDGIKAGYKSDNTNIDLFYSIIEPSVDVLSTGTPSKYPYNAISDTSITATGLYADVKINKSHSISALLLMERDNKQTTADKTLQRYTTGISYNYKYYGFKALVEFAYQFGTYTNSNIKAYNLAVETSYSFEPFKIGGTIDIFSGMKSSDKDMKSFTRPFGAGHKFFGYMDFFPAIFSKSAYNPGLNDFVLNFEYKATNKPLYINADLHHFMSNVEFKMADGRTSSNIGQEIDLKFGYQVVKGAILELGASAFIPSDVMKDAFMTTNGKRDAPALWTYLQLKVDL